MSTLDVHFNFPEHYFNAGYIPNVALANGRIVAIHEDRLLGRDLHYLVGTPTGCLVNFGPARPAGGGENPAIAVNAAGTVVEVHETSRFSSFRMYFRVGPVSDQRQDIGFGTSTYYGDGKRPRVALNDSNAVVTVHETSSKIYPSRKYYRVGIVDPGRKHIDFGGSHLHGDGKNPAIAINNKDKVIHVFRWRARRGDYHLWYQVGTVDRGKKTINFGARTWYDEHGDVPSIALSDDGFVIAVHQASHSNNCYSRVGWLNEKTGLIEWSGEKFLTLRGGATPAVAIERADRSLAVQVNRRGLVGGAHAMRCAGSMVIDRSSWMADNRALIGDKRLMEIAMPASHDAHMAITHGCVGLASACQTQTQNHGIWGQLIFGCRYFDIRPVLFRGRMETGHFSGARGCLGQSVESVLGDVNKYLEGGGRDLVILVFSHYWNRDRGTGAEFTDADMRALLHQVTKGPLRTWLYDQTVPPAGLQSVTLDDYIGKGGRVLAVFDKLKPSIQREFTGAYSYANTRKGPSDANFLVFDHYAGKNSVPEMIEDQMTKLAKAANHGRNLFLLSWTLTQSSDDAINCALGASTSVLEFAWHANVTLWRRLVQAQKEGKITRAHMTNLIYTDDVAGTQTDLAIWLNRQILAPV